MTNRDPTDDETILQAWFGSPLKTIITVGGFLGFAFIGYSTLGETNPTGSEAGKTRYAPGQSSTRSVIETAQAPHETSSRLAAPPSISSIFGYWRFESEPNGCAESVTTYTAHSVELYVYNSAMRELELEPKAYASSLVEYRVHGGVIFVRVRNRTGDYYYDAFRVIDGDTIEELGLLDAYGRPIDEVAVMLDQQSLPPFDSVRAGAPEVRWKRCDESAAAAFIASVRSIADRPAQLRASRPDEPIRCGVTVDCRSRPSVLRELARVGSLLRSRGNPFWENCARSMTDIKGFDHRIWEVYTGTERDAAGFLAGFLASCNAGLHY